MSGTEFNKSLWEERFNNLKTDISEVNGKVDGVIDLIKDLIKYLITIMIALIGWSLIQIYGHIVNKAQAAIPVASSIKR